MSKIDASQRRENDPVKWKKHLVLVDWGLRDFSHLIHSITRYSFQNYQECLDDISTEMNRANGDFTYIVKLVFKYNYLKLPNIIINSPFDLLAAREHIAKYNQTMFSEIWYCKNKTQKDTTVFGRMLVDCDALFPERGLIRYELVWSASARSIERYPSVNCPFIAFEKSNWNSEPTIGEIIQCKMKLEEMVRCAKDINKYTMLYAPQIKEFGSFVFSKGCKSLCLEFSLCNGLFSFIDWDTDNDNLVLRALK